MSKNNQNKNKNKNINNKSKKSQNSSKIKKIVLAGGIILVIIASSIFIYNRNKSENKHTKLPTIENVQQSADSSANEDNSNENSNKNESNETGYVAAKDNSTKVEGKETDDAIVAKIAFAVGNMIDDSIISHDYWTKDYNQTTLNGILGDKIEVEFDFSDRDTFQRNLIKGTGANAQAMVPVIKDLSADRAAGANAQAKIDETRIKKLNDNQYEATLTLAKTVADNYEGFDPKDLTYTAKEILDDYEEAGTLDEYTDIDNEKLIIEKVEDGKWTVKFARDTWYLAKGGN